MNVTGTYAAETYGAISAKPMLTTTRSLLIEPRLGSVGRLEIDKAKLAAWRANMVMRKLEKRT